MIVDCNAEPLPREGYIVEEHRKGGLLDLSRVKLSLHPVEGQIAGHRLRELLTDEPVLNANLLGALLENPNRIPEEWKGMRGHVFFWGTIYRKQRGGELHVPYLIEGTDNVWRSDLRDLGYEYHALYPAAVLRAA